MDRVGGGEEGRKVRDWVPEDEDMSSSHIVGISLATHLGEVGWMAPVREASSKKGVSSNMAGCLVVWWVGPGWWSLFTIAA